MEPKEYRYVDSSHAEHTVTILPEDLTLVHDEKKLFDSDLKGKTTTYFKDILRRFLKNKVSVFGFAIIALIVLGSASVALSMPDFNIAGANATEVSLPAKLFPAGTGWWDGTVKRENAVWDQASGLPVDGNGNLVNPEAILGGAENVEKTVEYVDVPDDYATGGYFAVRGEGARLVSRPLAFDFETAPEKNYSYSLTYRIDDAFPEGTPSDGAYRSVPSYDVFLSYSTGAEDRTIPVASGGTAFGADQTVDLKSLILSAEPSFAGSGFTASLAFAPSPGSGGESALYVGKAVFATEDPNFETERSIASFENPAVISRRSPDAWSFEGAQSGGIWGAKLTRGTYVFDPYADVYGKVDGVWTTDNLQRALDQGAVTIHDPATGAELSFSDLTAYQGRAIRIAIQDASAVNLAEDQDALVNVSNTVLGTTVSLSVRVWGWKALGYNGYPVHILGTDKQGRDLLKVTATGTLYSLGIASLIFLFCFAFGLVWGALSGYFGGAVDIAMERLVEVVSGIPLMVLLTLFLVVFGRSWSIFIFAMCFSGWIGTAGITRTQFYRFKRREYVLASRSLGASDPRLIFRHILPNGMGTIITSTVLMVPSIIYAEAGLAYLGLGFTNITSLGVILSDNQPYLLTDPLLILWPSLIIAFLMISFELFGQGLRDAFNPSTKGAD